MSELQQSRGWQLEESSADAYERYLVPLFFAPGAEYLNQLAATGPGERVLDVACGTGAVARRAAQQVGADGTVVGLDLNEGMLGVARRVSQEVHPPIEWRQGDAADMPLADGSFDVVLCQQGLQFFPEQPAALREMYRVLVPSGRVALSVLRSIEHNPGYVALSEALERHVGADAGAMIRSPFSSLSTEELRHLVAGVGFQDVRILIGVGTVRYPSAEEFLLREGASSPLAGPIRALGDDVRQALVGDLGQALRAHTDDDGIVFPTEAYFAVAHR